MNKIRIAIEMQTHRTILLFLSALGGIDKAFDWTEVDIIRVGSLVNSSEVVNYFFRVKKINRTTCAISGTVQILAESIEANNFRAGVFHSANGNNQFRLFPFKVEPSEVPKLLNGPYRTYVMDDLKPPVSDVPYSNDGNVDLSELILKPANYTLNGYTVALKKIPKMIPNGLYKLLCEVTTVAGDLVGGFYVLIKRREFDFGAFKEYAFYVDF